MTARLKEAAVTEDPHPRVSRSRFIRLGAALGVGAAASSTLVACGGSETGSGGGSGGSSGSSSGSGEESVASGSTTQAQAPEGTAEERAEEAQQESGSSGGQAIAQEGAVAPGSAMPFQDEGNDAVLVHLESGEFVAYSAICTHQACTVAYRDAQLVCPCHGSVFDPANGAQVVVGPAETPLQEIPVEVRNGEVFKA
jgi:cytochrome b6-f complex iron-sulfur subunit